MSLLGSIGKVLTGAVKTVAGTAVGGAIGGPIGAAIGGTLASSGSKLAAKGVAGATAAAATLKTLPAVMPGAGAVARTALPALAGGAAAMIYDHMGNPIGRRRRRRKGISAKDLSSFRRVARLIDKYAAPVHRLRKSSFKPHH